MNNYENNERIKQLSWKDLFKHMFAFSILCAISCWAISSLVLHGFNKEKFLINLEKNNKENVIGMGILISVANFLWFCLLSWGDKTREEEIFKQFEEDKEKALAENKAEIRELKADLVILQNKLLENK